jgi:hypothetical protein
VSENMLSAMTRNDYCLHAPQLAFIGLVDALMLF